MYSDTLIIKAVPPGIYMVEWIDPVTGSVKSSEKLNHSDGNLKLSTPEYSLDIVLKVTRSR